MNQVTIGSQLTTQLGDLVEPVELVDASGRRLGHFVPTVSVGADQCPYSNEELEAMRHEGGGRSLAEILASLVAK